MFLRLKAKATASSDPVQLHICACIVKIERLEVGQVKYRTGDMATCHDTRSSHQSLVKCNESVSYHSH